MPTSKKYARRMGWALVLVLLSAVVDVGLTLALEQYAIPTEVTWYNYRHTEPATIDTLVVGTSYASFGVNPAALDERLGSSTYNLSTMAQTLPESLDCVRCVAADHRLKRVICCIGPESLQADAQYDREVAFMQAKSLGEPVPGVLGNVAALAFDEVNFPTSKSLGWLVPWRFVTVPLDAASIRANVQSRLTYPDPTEAMTAANPRWVYLGGGQCTFDEQLDFQKLSPDDLAIDSAEPFLDRNLREFDNLLDACASYGIPVYVVVAPRPDHANLAHQDSSYPTLMASLKERTEAHGATYLDLNLAVADFYRPQAEDFSDTQHLNVSGSRRFSDALGTLLAAIEEGEDTSPLFYSYDAWDRYLDSFDDLVLCSCRADVAEGQARLTAESVAKPGMEVEYQFEVAEAGTTEYRVVRPFSAEPTCEVALDGRERLEVRVTARIADTTDERGQRINLLAVS